MQILISPHNDDESLFTCYTIMREKPLVVIVYNGDQHSDKFGISVQERKHESAEAMKLLGVEVEYLNMNDWGDDMDYYTMCSRLEKYKPDKVYAPAKGKNPQHNLVSIVCDDTFKNVVHYCTYDDNLLQKGSIEIKPTKEEMELKNKCLDCYKSQLKINPHHFEAVRNKSEYYE